MHFVTSQRGDFVFVFFSYLAAACFKATLSEKLNSRKKQKTRLVSITRCDSHAAESFSRSAVDFFGCFRPATTQHNATAPCQRWRNLSSPVSPTCFCKNKTPTEATAACGGASSETLPHNCRLSSSLRRRDLIRCKALAVDYMKHFPAVHSSRLICGEFTDGTETHRVVGKH